MALPQCSNPKIWSYEATAPSSGLNLMRYQDSHGQQEVGHELVTSFVWSFYVMGHTNSCSKTLMILRSQISSFRYTIIRKYKFQFYSTTLHQNLHCPFVVKSHSNCIVIVKKDEALTTTEKQKLKFFHFAKDKTIQASNFPVMTSPWMKPAPVNGGVFPIDLGQKFLPEHVEWELYHEFSLFVPADSADICNRKFQSCTKDDNWEYKNNSHADFHARYV